MTFHRTSYALVYCIHTIYKVDQDDGWHKQLDGIIGSLLLPLPSSRSWSGRWDGFLTIVENSGHDYPGSFQLFDRNL